MTDEPAQQAAFLPAESAALTRESTLEDVTLPFKAFLRDAGKTNNTIRAFNSDLNLMKRYFGADATLGSFTATKLQEYMAWVENGQGEGIPCSAKSYARRVTTLKVLFKWLHENKIILADPARPVPQRSISAPLPTILSDEEVDRLLAETARRRFADKDPDARPELLVRLLLDTGIKKSECMALRPSDIRREGPRPTLGVRRRTARDVYKERRVAFNPDWLEVLDEYMEQYRPPEHIFNCTARNLEYVLTDLAEAAAIPNVSFELLRWTCAVRDFRAGMSHEDLREKLGLSRISWRETGAKIERLAAGTEQSQITQISQ